MKQLQDAIAIAIAGLNANSELLAALARKGLLSPDDIEAISESVMSCLRQPAVSRDEQILEVMANYVESATSGPLAAAMQAAKANWNGE